MKSNKGFTMVELMVVVLIVGILAAVAVPLMSGRIDSSKWSEAKAGMGTIASALRSYAAEKGNFLAAEAPTIAQLGISDNDLDGTYFTHQAYALTSASASGGVVSFVITCTAASSTRSGKPTSPAVMRLTGSSAGQVFAEGAAS
jgi:prepilin-type N-terminal cleavage/methylation domain-containing protein